MKFLKGLIVFILIIGTFIGGFFAFEKTTAIGIKFAKAEYEICEGESKHLLPDITKGLFKTNFKLVYHSADTNKLTYEDGIITAYEKGRVIIKVYLENDESIFAVTEIKIVENPNYFTAIYDIDETTDNTANPKGFTKDDLPIKLKDPIRDGYIFKGWFRNESTQGDPTTEINENNILEDGTIKLFPYWIEKEYTINYILDGGTNHVDNQSLIKTSAFPVELLAPEKPGFDFLGWFSDSELQDRVHVLTELTDITLFAKWRETKISVRYELDGGNNHENNLEVITSSQLPFKLFSPQKEGFEFLGWFSDQDFTTQVKTLTELANTTLYAKWFENEYSLTYILDGGINHHDNPTTITTSQLPLALLNPHKEDHLFLGWFKDAGFTERVSVLIESSDHILFAKWEPLGEARFNIAYRTNGGENHPDNPVQFSEADLPLMLFAPTKNKFVFKGWYERNDFSGEEITHITEFKNYTLYAKWEQVEAQITYHLNGGENHRDNPETITKENINTILKNPTRAGYNFLGWYLDSDFTGKSITMIDTITDISLYAKWEVRTYEIIYNVGKGSNAKDNPATFSINDIGFTFKEPTRENYLFRGWYLTSTFSGEPITQITELKNLTLFAKWEIVDATTYTITYHLDGGINHKDNLDSFTIIDLPVHLYKPTKEGHRFDGWFTTPDFSSDEVLSINTRTDLDLYAKWTQVLFNIDYELNGGTNNPNNPNTFTAEDITLEIFAPTREGYEFSGWFIDRELTTRIDSIDEAKNYTVYAGWDIIIRSIEYHLSGGINNPKNPKVFTINDLDFTLYEPTRENYRFDGWYQTSIFSNKIETITQLEDHILYAKWQPISFQITYHLNGGDNHPNNLAQFNVTHLERQLYTPSKPGYKFTGWYQEADFSGSVITHLNEPKNYELFARWEELKEPDYTIFYHIIDGENHPDNLPTFTAKDLPITLYAPSKQGYEFLGWYANSAFAGNKIDTITEAKDITLYPKWSKLTFNIDYDLDGGTNHHNNPSTFTIDELNYELYKPTKEAYEFVGWFSDSQYLNLVTNLTQLQDYTLYAKWRATEFIVTYHIDSDITNNDNPTKFTINDLDISLHPATQTGFSFIGWYEDAKFNGPKITKLTEARDYDLYAKWELITYQVTYHLNGGVNHEENTSNLSIENLGVMLYQPMRQGYEFKGWFETADFSGSKIVQLNNLRNYTLYAKWEKIVEPQYEITYILNRGINHPQNPANITASSLPITLQAPTRVGYTFLGWYESYDFSSPVITTITQPNNYVFYARWEKDEYSIAYNVNGGTNNQANLTNFTVDDLDFTLFSPVKEGFEFLGWFEDADFSGVELTKITQLKDYTLYAKWELKEFTIIYHLDGGNNHENNLESFSINDLPLTLEDPEKNGFIFMGWFTNSNYTGEKVTEIVTLQDITLYAHFIEEGQGDPVITQAIITAEESRLFADYFAAYLLIQEVEDEVLRTNLLTRLNKIKLLDGDIIIDDSTIIN